jgi:hypothetical protein
MAAAKSIDLLSLRLLLKCGCITSNRSVNGFSPLVYALFGSAYEKNATNNNSNESGSLNNLNMSSSASVVSIHTNNTGFLSSQSTVTAHHSYSTGSEESKGRDAIDARNKQLCINEILGLATTKKDIDMLNTMDEDIKSFQLAKLLAHLRDICTCSAMHKN